MPQKTITNNTWPSVKTKFTKHELTIESKQTIHRVNILEFSETKSAKPKKVECRDRKNMTELAKRGLIDRLQIL